MSGLMNAAGDVVVLAGALIFLSAALGVVRFPDPYMRVSAVGTAGGLGISLVVLGTLLEQPSTANLVKSVIIIALQLITSALGSMMIARSAHLTGVPLWNPAYDDLHDEMDELHAADRTERERPPRDS